MVTLIACSQSPIFKQRSSRSSSHRLGAIRPVTFHWFRSGFPRFRRLQFHTLVLPVVTDEIDNRGQQIEGRQIEDKLMETIGQRNYEDIEKLVTPRTLQKCESNTLLLSMKVNNNNDEGTR